MPYRIRKTSRNDDRFYQDLGPWFGSRAAQSEIGYPIYDDLGKAWYLAVQENAIAGFCSVLKGVVSDCYVLSQYRRTGALTSMLDAILVDYPGKLRASCTAMSIGTFQRAGFSVVSASKNYTRVVKDA